jgi:hypothetical protein
MNLDYQRAGRVLPFPFAFLNNNHAMNVRPAHYSWPEFYGLLVDLSRYSFSWRAIGRRLTATEGAIPRWMNVVRAMSSEGWGRIRYHTTIRKLLDTDADVRGFLEGTTAELPGFYADRIEHDLGPLNGFRPAGSVMHDPNAYLKTSMATTAVTPLQVGRRGSRAATETRSA